MAACSGSTSDNNSTQSNVATTETNKPSATPTDACALVTKADAERILGESVKDPKDGGYGGGSMS